MAESRKTYMDYNYPTGIPESGSVLTNGETRDYKSGEILLTKTWIGRDVVMLASANDHREGDAYNEGDMHGTIRSSKTTKIEDNRTKWTLTVSCPVGSGGESPLEEDDPIKETWSQEMAQCSFPLYRFCAPSADPASEEWGNAAWLKAWETEDNAELKAAYKFRKPANATSSGGETALSGRTLDIAKKMMAGYTEVMRFYPTVTLVTKCQGYGKIHGLSSRASAFGHIDNDPEYSPKRQFGNWSVDWLKNGYNWSQDDAETWTLTETWWGSPYEFGGWLPEFYSKDDDIRWRFFPTSETEA